MRGLRVTRQGDVRRARRVVGTMAAEPAMDDAVDAEATYALETPVRCSACTELISEIRVVRMLRSRVNFTSTLPRRGRVIACPRCLSVISGELGNLT